MKIDPREIEGFNRILTGVVVPRPIAWVSTVSKNGQVNLAPFSFFNAVAQDPPTLVFSCSRFVGDKRKDTLVNVEETGEFVVNLVTDDVAEAMNKTAAEYPAGVNEFRIAGVTEVPSNTVKAPRVAESPVNLECKLVQVVNIGGGKRQNGLVIGEIQLLHIRDDLINGHRVNQQALKPVGRLAGNMYCHTGDIFELIRPVYRPD